MHEVHGPEHSVATWKGFILHMGTITLGLLLAIGLEQSVEAIHRHHEAKQLRRDLMEECREEEANLHNAIDEYRRNYAAWNALKRAESVGGTFDCASFKHGADFHQPNDPIWRAAVTDQSAGTLSREEVRIF